VICHLSLVIYNSAAKANLREYLWHPPAEAFRFLAEIS
jgi:hypothetical protein